MPSLDRQTTCAVSITLAYSAYTLSFIQACIFWGKSMAALAVISWTPIFSLLSHRSPSTIVRLIIPVSINAVNGMFRTWPFSHIKQEITKALWASPTFTNFDAPPSIILELCIRMGVASRVHSGKNKVQLGSRSSVCYGHIYDFSGVMA